MLLEIVLIIMAALLVDNTLGELSVFHPLVGFGRMASMLEKHLNKPGLFSVKLKGSLAWLLLLVPIVFLTIYLV